MARILGFLLVFRDSLKNECSYEKNGFSYRIAHEMPTK
nr:MAG TPA: hypothetical protein [Caudoviricetes sp.]